MEEIEQLGTILGIWAHPDDETYLSGGLMAAAVEGGQRVACVTATAGEQGTDDPERWPPDELASRRRDELAEALEVLGVGEHTWLDYADGECDSVDDGRAVERLAGLIADVRPDTVLTFGPDGVTGHPDHITVGRWAWIAARRAAPGARVLRAAKDADWIRQFRELHERLEVFEPGYPLATPQDRLSVRLELSDGLLDRKVAALRAQESQTAPVIAAAGADIWREWVRVESFAPLEQG